ncbi:hypothetical protein [Flavobacterium sp.]|uniref:hypothetical protein n=1 Tax=Flavobacterium sp. TaxID=239 RepID=UPI004033CFB0
MKVRPILYSTQMVQAIKDGRKTQTRRILKLLPADAKWFADNECEMAIEPRDVPKGFQIFWNDVFDPESDEPIDRWRWFDDIACPYGDPGDMLYVRETYYAYGYWITNGVTATGKHKYRFVDLSCYSVWQDKGFGYRYYDDPPDEILSNSSLGKMGYHKRPSLFMPKAAARFFQKIKRRWAERLNDISEADAISEGVELDIEYQAYKDYQNDNSLYVSAKDSFRTIWEMINGKGTWDKNPFVWCVEFELTDNPWKDES